MPFHARFVSSILAACLCLIAVHAQGSVQNRPNHLAPSSAIEEDKNMELELVSYGILQLGYKIWAAFKKGKDPLQRPPKKLEF